MGQIQCGCAPDDDIDFDKKRRTNSRSPASDLGLSISPTRPQNPRLSGRSAVGPPNIMSPLPYGYIPGPAQRWVSSPEGGRQCSFSRVPAALKPSQSIRTVPRLTAGLPSVALVRILRLLALSLDGSLRCATVCRRWNREISAFLRIACSGCRAVSPLSDVAISSSVVISPQQKVRTRASFSSTHESQCRVESVPSRPTCVKIDMLLIMTHVAGF